MTNVEVEQGADGRSMCTGDAMFVEALYTVTVSEDGQPSTEFDAPHLARGGGTHSRSIGGRYADAGG
ncbi:MAG: hypothetical protein QOF73_3857 [Thermomicrobiales bacterium]|nr:hypothetical protein [Thermomicrobiales bacterium]